MSNVSLLVRFLLVGGSTSAIYLGLTFVLVEGSSIQATLASTIACIAAVIYNYVLHYHWTFASDAPQGRVLVRYVLMCFGGILLNAAIIHFGVVKLSMHYMLTQVSAGIVLVCWSITLSSFWVFKSNQLNTGQDTLNKKELSD